MSPLYLICLYLPLQIVTPTPTYECILPHPAQTRIFPSLLDFQHNQQSFSPKGAGYAGNMVQFSFKSVDRLLKNSFITFTSQYIWKITLNSKQIKEIDDGAFLNLNCLHELDLSNNSLRVLAEGTWEGLGNLELLNLEGNVITQLDNLVFRELVGLKRLLLGRNRIDSIGLEAFEGLERLETLDLGNNLLRRLLPETLSPLPNLATLQLNTNFLQHLEPHLWKNVNKLTNLNLAGNSLTSFDPNYNYSFTALVTLNLSMNSLTKLNVHSLRKQFPILATIDLNGNHWLCEDLVTIIPALRDSRITYVKTQNPNITNEDGIPCNYNSDVYKEETIAVTTIKSEIVETPSTINPLLEEHLQNASVEIRDEMRKTNEEILNSMEKTRNLIVSLMVLVIIFIAFELTLRTGLVNRVIRRRGDNYLNDVNVNDNIALLST